MAGLGIRNVLLVAVAAACAGVPAAAQDPFTRSPQYPGVTVIAVTPPPLDARAAQPPDCGTALCLPARITVTNTSARVIKRAWLVIRLPEVTDGDWHYGIAVFFNNRGDDIALLQPNQTVELEVDAAKIAGLDSYLATRGRSLRSLTKALILVTHVEFEDGGYFTPAGYSAGDR